LWNYTVPSEQQLQERLDKNAVMYSKPDANNSLEILLHTSPDVTVEVVVSVEFMALNSLHIHTFGCERYSYENFNESYVYVLELVSIQPLPAKKTKGE